MKKNGKYRIVKEQDEYRIEAGYKKIWPWAKDSWRPAESRISAASHHINFYYKTLEEAHQRIREIRILDNPIQSEVVYES